MASLTKDQKTLFWNVFSNIQKEIENPSGYDYDREVLTYVQADNRYLTYLDDYLKDNTSMSQSEKTDMRQRAQAAFEQSNKTLNDPGYAYSTTIQGMANDLYDRVEHNDKAALGAIADAPAPVVAQQKIEPAVTASVANPVVKPVEAVAATPKFEPVATPIKPEDFAQPVKPVLNNRDIAETPPKAATLETNDYQVKRGDNLWNVAKEYYGLTKPADIKQAVEYIATVNHMTKGTDANHLKIGQTIKLPDSPKAPESQNAESLNWAALDKETRSGGISSHFTDAALGKTRQAFVAPVPENKPLALTL